MTVGITELPPEGMQLPGVALAGDADRGTKTTEGISLLFTTAGITVQGPQPQIERLLVWAALDSATCHEVVQLADGREAAIMELTSGGQSIRFLLPSDTVSPGQAAYLDQALPTWLARYRGPVPAAPSRGPEVGVTLPASGPSPATAQAAAPNPVEASAEAPAQSYVTAGVAAAAGAAAVGARPDAASPNGAGHQPGDGSAPGMSPTGYMATAPPAPAAPATGAAPPPPAAPTFRPAAPPAPPVSFGSTPPAGGRGLTAPPAATSAWDDPPLALPEAEAPAKTPWYKLAPRKPKATEAAAGVAVVGALAPDPVVAAPPTPTAAPATPGAPSAGTASTDATPVDGKTPWYKLAPRKPDGVAAGAAVAGVAAVAPASPPAPAAPAAADPPAPVDGAAEPAAPADGKTPWYKLAPRKPKTEAAAAGAAAATAVGAGAAPSGPAANLAAPTTAPPSPPAPPSDPVPPAVRPPAPTGSPAVQGTSGEPATGDGAPGGTPSDGASGDDGTSGVVLAPAAKRPNRAAVIALAAVLVLVIAGGVGYALSKRGSSSTSTAPAPATPPVSAAADTVLAASVNLRLADLPTGWTQAAPAAAVVRPPAAPAAAQSAATNTLSSCLGTSYPVAAGLFGAGSLPNQTSLVQSPTFQSAAGSSFEMGSKTMTLGSAGQVQALDAVFANPKFDACYQQYATALAAGAVAGATAAVQPVTLTGPTGVQAYGIVTTYSLPGQGTEVVGNAYMLGGRVVAVLTPSTNGPAIASDVFAPAYDAMVGRVAASASK